MHELDDIALLRRYAEQNSEAAFAILVERHVNKVYSVALRHTRNIHAAEEITQAVFVILAKKAGRLGGKVIIAGWLYETARLTALTHIRSEIRRARREQEAQMQTPLNQNDDEIWPHIAPLLDDALARLSNADRRAVVMRYFDGKSLGEVGAALGASEDAAKKRVSRAVEKLRGFFAKRGVTLTATVLTAAITANSVQAAPVGLAATVAGTAAKGAVVSGSTLTLIKGALKVMAWTNAKTAIVVAASLLVAGTATVAVDKGVTRMNSVLTQRLEDGSTLVLNRVSFGDEHRFGGGSPTNSWKDPGHDRLVVEFRLTAKDGANHPLVKPAFFRQFRCVVHGQQGIEYVEEFSPPGKFKEDAGNYYGYIATSIFPRDSKWLWFRIEKSETNNPYGPWHPVAEFKTVNPTRSADRKWVASPPPTTNVIEGMNFVLGEVTVEMRPLTPRDIWNHVVTIPTQVFEGGVLLTNWSATHCTIQDASGNWNPILQFHRSLDPRFVWKLQMDFEPVSDFPDGSIVTVSLPQRAGTITTNVMNVPVTISFDGNNWIEASMPTNRPDLALRYISATDDQGETLLNPSGGGGQYAFREGSFMARGGGVLHMGDVKAATVAIAVVPSVHTTFYTQPKLVVGKVN